MIKSTTVKAATRALLPLLFFAMVLSLFAQFTSSPTADALTITTTTAKSNETVGNNVIGGKPTRITWEAMVDEGEDVRTITLVFPEGSYIAEGANARATILKQEDPRLAAQRVEVEQTYTISDTGATIIFGEDITEGFIIRIEIFNIALPAEAGSYVISGSYTDSHGKTYKLPDSDEITVISMTAVESMIEWLDQQGWVEAWNSVLFLRIFLNPLYVVAAIPNLFFGWLVSFGLVLVGFPLAIPIGLCFSFLRMAKLRILRFLGSIYVNVVRGTPLFLQIYIAFIGLPLLGLKLDNYLLGIIVLALNSSAYLAEIFRAGIQSIHKGQFEASASLGMNGVQTMFFVIIPQTVRRVIPTATSEFILLYKDTSLLAAVGVMEQMMFAKSMVANGGNMTPYLISACYYLIITLPLTKLIASFEQKLSLAESHGAAAQPKKRKLLGGLKNALPIATPTKVIIPDEAISADEVKAVTSDEENEEAGTHQKPDEQPGGG